MRYTIARETPDALALILGVARRENLPHWADGVELELAYVDGTDDTFIWVNRTEDGTITAAYPGIDFAKDGTRINDLDKYIELNDTVRVVKSMAADAKAKHDDLLAEVERLENVIEAFLYK